MIPKIIHYCWFGGSPLPKLAQDCIASWKKYLPEYEIKEWNESNFDINIIPYTAEAYKNHKYAFVSDYARFWVLYNYGGLYFDTDVEVIRPMDDIIARGPWMGCEKEACDTSVASVAPGLGLGVNPGLGLYKELLNLYATLHFKNEDGSLNLKTIVEYTTEMLCNYGLKQTNDIQECAGIWVYPKEYFCPKDYYTGKINITNNTCSIHHYDASWVSQEKRFALSLERRLRFLPKRIASYFSVFVAAIKFRGFFSGVKDLCFWVKKSYEK